ncbi:unnamed protein product [Protopolystoma xenopodis]|uniref:Uncharacterized protein n=1 Tax=Protopolystoma xenopodis TaxID=117903 RepID=A0A448WLL6_9PLAT|nr:unnamed protein product [Protopolystoma xenopodis]
MFHVRGPTGDYGPSACLKLLPRTEPCRENKVGQLKERFRDCRIAFGQSRRCEVECKLAVHSSRRGQMQP